MLEFYFRFRSRPFCRNLHVILHQAAETTAPEQFCCMSLLNNMLWFTLSNAKAKLTVSVIIERLSTTVWVEGAQAQEGTTQNCKGEMVSDCITIT